MTIRNMGRLVAYMCASVPRKFATDCFAHDDLFFFSTVILLTIVPVTSGRGKGFDEVVYCNFLIKMISETIVRRKIVGTIVVNL